MVGVRETPSDPMRLSVVGLGAPSGRRKGALILRRMTTEVMAVEALRVYRPEV